MYVSTKPPVPARDMITRFIRHDPAVCIMPGLFLSLKKGEERAKLNVNFDLGDGRRLGYSGSVQLGVDDLRVLQGLVSLGLRAHRIISPDTTDMGEQADRRCLELEHDAQHMDALVVSGSFADLAREIGHADLNDTLTMRTCLKRMQNVSVTVESNADRVRHLSSFRLLSECGKEQRGRGGRLRVALNPQLTEIILGRRTKRVRIDMAEVRALKSDHARLIHQQLCARIGPGKSGKTSIETLCGYIWLDEAKDDAIRMRRTRARKALQELVALGWRVDEYEIGKYKITRPGTKKNVGHARNATLDPGGCEAA